MSYKVEKKNNVYFVTEKATDNVVARYREESPAIADAKERNFKQAEWQRNIKGNVTGNLDINSPKHDAGGSLVEEPRFNNSDRFELQSL